MNAELGGPRYRYQDLQRLFDLLFYPCTNTRLLLGETEPLYLPADDQVAYHRVIFARGHFSSALHEVAHWCIAGEQRRQKVDYGYWYVADGRNSQQQAEFERVEVKPQALEWLFAQACGRPFHPSTDNLNAELVDDSRFRRALLAQVYAYCEYGLPARACAFRAALCAYYGQPEALQVTDFGSESSPVEYLPG